MHRSRRGLNRRAIGRLFLLALLISMVAISPMTSAAGSNSSTRRAQRLAQLRARLAALPPRQHVAIGDTGQSGHRAPAGAAIDLHHLPDPTRLRRSYAAQTTVATLAQPAPIVSATQSRQVATAGICDDQPSLCDASNPINAYSPYSLFSGHDVADIGLMWSGAAYSPQNANLIQAYCGMACINPQMLNQQNDQWALQNALGSGVLGTADYWGNYGLNLYGAITGGTFSEFTGQPAPVYQWNAAFQGATYAGPGFSSPSLDPSTLAVLGYDDTSAYNFGTQYLMNVNNLQFAPWTDPSVGFGGFALQRSSAPSAHPAGALNDILARYSAIGQQQIDIFFTDTNLSDLRSEANAFMIAKLYQDPLYIYYSYALDQVVQQVAAQTPTYQNLQALAAQIESWTNPPTNQQALAQRYIVRLEYVYYQALVGYETQLLIANNADLSNWVPQVAQALTQYQQASWSDQQANDWYHGDAFQMGWADRWNNAYVGSTDYTQFRTDMQQLLADHPAFGEYQQTKHEVIDMLPQFQGNPDVGELTQLSQTVLSNPQVAQQIDQQYDQYRQRADTLLVSSGAVLTQERYYEQMNGLVNNDSLYQLAVVSQYLSIADLQQVQQQVYSAVDYCYRAYGYGCDPYSDPYVLSILTNAQTQQIIANVGQAYEIMNLYWYLFYNSTDYQQLEQATSGEALAELQPLLPAVQQARSSFQHGVLSIPEVQQLQTKSAQVVQRLRGRSMQTSTLTTQGALSLALDQRLTRMAQLAAQLRGGSVSLVPLIRR